MKIKFSISAKLLFLILNFQFFISKSQFYNLPGDYSYALMTERILAEKDSSVHSSVKPYIPFFSDKYKHVGDTFNIFKYITDDPAIDKVFNDHLIDIKSKERTYRLTIDPVLNFEYGKDTEDTVQRRLYTNSRGFIASGSIGKDFYVESMLVENQSVFPNYIETQNNKTLIVPGQGRWKAFKGRGFDYAFSSGFISYQPSKHLNIQLGHGKQKIGNGYRSLFLSDNALNYPYVRFTQNWFKGRLQYTNIYASLMNLDSASTKIPANTERLFQKKGASFQHLSINFGKSLNIGFFQGMIWKVADRNNVQHLDWQFYNPVIFTNLAYYGLNDKNNIVAGGDLTLKITKRISLYAQLMLDDMSDTRTTGNGMGYQVGLKCFDVFKVKNWFFQAEYNDVSESAYSSPITSYPANQSYSQYNQNLAYTPGYGKEMVLITDYKYRRFFINAKYNYQYYTANGSDLMANHISNVRLGYTINPSYNANISIGVNYRVQDYFLTKTSDNKTAYLYLSFKTNLYNAYFDF